MSMRMRCQDTHESLGKTQIERTLGEVGKCPVHMEITVLHCIKPGFPKQICDSFLEQGICNGSNWGVQIVGLES